MTLPRSVLGFLFLWTVSFTLPRYYASADSGSCFESPLYPTPMNDLDSVFVYETIRGTYRRDLVVARNVRGMEGVFVTYPIVDPLGAQATIEVFTRRIGLTRPSCFAVIGINQTTDVPLPPPDVKIEQRALYGVNGGRVTPPLRPGVYFEKIGRRTYRIVVIR